MGMFMVIWILRNFSVIWLLSLDETTIFNLISYYLGSLGRWIKEIFSIYNNNNLATTL